MFERRIADWDDAYANMPNVPNGEAYPDRWALEAAAFRDGPPNGVTAELGIAYGDGGRNRYDLFRPDGSARGIVIFVHGGYWMRFDNRYFSHLAAGPLARGWAVAMPAYSLCPEVRITDIVGEIAAAVGAVGAKLSGPLRLIGHSAGGHLVSRMICADRPAGREISARIEQAVSLSGVHDLRPLMRTELNATLQLDDAEAARQSPALLEPAENARLTCWVGAGERSEFVRQNALLANIWLGLGAATRCVEEADRHHFNVVEALSHPDSPLTECLLA